MEKYIKINLLLGLIVVLYTSCSIDEVAPRNALLEDNLIRDEASAVAVLNGIYASYREGVGSGAPFITPTITANFAYSGQELEPLGGPNEFSTNNVQPTSFVLSGVYQSEYNTINLANFFIELVERGDANVDDTRKNELLAEARFFRANSHFNLLRVFGQFYDRNSSFGIVVSTKPFRGSEAFPRNTVQEAYDLIIADLQFASQNALDNREHFFVSATTALAVLSKVQLYMGQYDLASTNALSVINNTDGYSLASDYASIFNEKYGPETLYAPFTTDDSEGDIGVFDYQLGTSGPSAFFRNLADEQDDIVGNGSPDNLTGFDPRYSFIFSTTPDFPNPKYPFPGAFFGEGNTVNVLRMAEMYLIYAEAEARRTGGVLSDALDRLNAIRTRAGVTPKVLSDQATLLEDIREEKMLELFEETGETWFDFIRYDQLGNIDASTLKSTITGVDDLIFPIPQQALAGNGLLIPNP